MLLFLSKQTPAKCADGPFLLFLCPRFPLLKSKVYIVVSVTTV